MRKFIVQKTEVIIVHHSFFLQLFIFSTGFHMLFPLLFSSNRMYYICIVIFSYFFFVYCLQKLHYSILLFFNLRHFFLQKNGSSLRKFKEYTEILQYFNINAQQNIRSTYPSQVALQKPYLIFRKLICSNFTSKYEETSQGKFPQADRCFFLRILIVHGRTSVAPFKAWYQQCSRFFKIMDKITKTNIGNYILMQNYIDNSKVKLHSKSNNFSI